MCGCCMRRHHRSVPKALLLGGCHLLITLTAACGGGATALHLLLNYEARLSHARRRFVRAQSQLALCCEH